MHYFSKGIQAQMVLLYIAWNKMETVAETGKRWSARPWDPTKCYSVAALSEHTTWLPGGESGLAAKTLGQWKEGCLFKSNKEFASLFYFYNIAKQSIW